MESGVAVQDYDIGSHDSPELSVIIVSYNSEDCITRCIRDVVAAAAAVQFEVIQVDNASKDESVGAASREFGDAPWFAQIANEENFGFGKACNIGAARARGDYILFLNPDVFVLPGALRASLDSFAVQDRCGAVMARTFWDDERQFQFSSLKNMSPLAEIVHQTSLRRIFGGRIFEKFWRMDWAAWVSDAPVEVLGVPGGYLMMPRALFRELGGFDERFFMYYEDNDLCLRIRKAMHKIYLLPGATAIHYWGQSLRNYEGVGMRKTQRKSLNVFYAKHHPVLGRLLALSVSADRLATRAAKRLAALFLGGPVSGGIPIGSPDGIELRWKSVPGAEYYFLEVTQDPCFLHKVGARVVGNSYFLSHQAYRMLAPDVYFWRAVPMVGRQPVGKIQVGRFRVLAHSEVREP